MRAYGRRPADLGVFRALRRLHATVWYCLYAETRTAHRDRAAALVAGWRNLPSEQARDRLT